MPGDFDDLYIRARTALLDATDALAPHLDSIVLVGAQAIYLHTGAADLTIARSRPMPISAWTQALSATALCWANCRPSEASRLANTRADG